LAISRRRAYAPRVSGLGSERSSGREGQSPTGEALKALVDAARRGDRQAFEQLVRMTWAGTYTLAYRLTGNEEDALDVAQEAYLRALRGLPRFRGEARFSTWLYRVTANCASNHLARASRRQHTQLDPDGMDEAKVCDRRPEHALLRLPWRLREVVVLRDVYDLTNKSIAAELGISEAAAKVRLQRARKRLREDLVLHMAETEGPTQRWRRGLGKRAAHADGTSMGAKPVDGTDDDAVAS
jgi:RNA polymerase sigma-70 factor (ECF subfamily)